MGFSTKIQLIKRTASEQWYINFPSAVAQAMEFQKGEVVEWVIEDKQRIPLKRADQPVEQDKKKLLTSKTYGLKLSRQRLFIFSNAFYSSGIWKEFQFVSSVQQIFRNWCNCSELGNWCACPRQLGTSIHNSDF